MKILNINLIGLGLMIFLGITCDDKKSKNDTSFNVKYAEIEAVRNSKDFTDLDFSKIKDGNLKKEVQKCLAKKDPEQLYILFSKSKEEETLKFYKEKVLDIVLHSKFVSLNNVDRKKASNIIETDTSSNLKSYIFYIIVMVQGIITQNQIYKEALKSLRKNDEANFNINSQKFMNTGKDKTNSNEGKGTNEEYLDQKGLLDEVDNLNLSVEHKNIIMSYLSELDKFKYSKKQSSVYEIKNASFNLLRSLNKKLFFMYKQTCTKFLEDYINLLNKRYNLEELEKNTISIGNKYRAIRDFINGRLRIKLARETSRVIRLKMEVDTEVELKCKQIREIYNKEYARFQKDEEFMLKKLGETVFENYGKKLKLPIIDFMCQFISTDKIKNAKINYFLSE